MTYLLAVGDSWTDTNYKSHQQDTHNTFKRWPELLGAKLKIPRALNLGLAGGSNTYIFNQCYDQIIKEKPELVCILLSEWDRREIFTYQYDNSLNLHAHTKRNVVNTRDFHWSEWLEAYCEKEKTVVNFSEYIWKEWATVESVMRDTLRELFLFKLFCENNNIKYIIAQGIHPINDSYIKNSNPLLDPNLKDYFSYLKYFLTSPYFDRINSINMLDWPFFWELGGSSMIHKLYKLNDESVWVHKKDHHPSELGHKLISEYFYKGYIDVYN